MLVLTILSIFILIIVFIIFLEYRNEKQYQEKRRQHRQTSSRSERSTPPKETTEVTPKPERIPEPTPEPEVIQEKKPEVKTEPTVKPEPTVEVKPEPEVKEEPRTEPKTETVKETKALPEANYPPFTHVRLVEMGLSDEEAKEFVAELIPQLETQILRIEEAIDIPDFNEMERLTHEIKGAATNLGTGGVSDLLVEWNSYLKTGTDTDIARAYFKLLKHYTNELKVQYH